MNKFKQLFFPVCHRSSGHLKTFCCKMIACMGPLYSRSCYLCLLFLVTFHPPMSSPGCSWIRNSYASIELFLSILNYSLPLQNLHQPPSFFICSDECGTVSLWRMWTENLYCWRWSCFQFGWQILQNINVSKPIQLWSYPPDRKLTAYLEYPSNHGDSHWVGISQAQYLSLE